MNLLLSFCINPCKSHILPPLLSLLLCLISYFVFPDPVCPTCYEITTESFNTDPSGRVLFKTPLKQFISLAQVASDELADTAWVGVTFYDYRADCSNPDFQRYGGADPHPTGVYTPGMVQSTLDGDRKPIFKTCNSGYRECIINCFEDNTVFYSCL